jgi:mannosyl-3-phosphoglycerate phosphatase family protein
MEFDRLIYTDLDGSLLELESYNHRITASTVQQLSVSGIPIIFCSSKTLAEQRHYQNLFNLNSPMIIENGAGVAIPRSFHPYFEDLPHQIIDNYLLFSFTEGYNFILENLDRIRKELDLQLLGYHDLNSYEISKITGIAVDELERTTDRLFSETLLVGEFKAPNFQKLKQALFEVDLQCTPGSKFFTISGLSSNKGKAIQWLTNHLKKINSKDFKTIGIGDSFNDLSMLAEVDRPFLVQKPDQTFAKIEFQNLMKIEKPGPLGWNEIIEQHVGFS